MDARKIQFLIGIQREIDKLEAKDGNTPKIERVKSRFYDVVEVEEIIVQLDHSIANPVGLIVSESDEEIKNLIKELKESKPQKSRSHAPKSVTRFLKQFKFDNSSGLKELVHSPDNPEKFDFRECLYSGLGFSIKIFKENFLPNKLSERVIKLFESLCTDGLKYWNEYHKHPIYNNNSVTEVIQKFKQSYRFDEEATEATILRDMIEDVASRVQYSKSIGFYDRFDKIEFKPDNDFFDINNIFFADVESFRSGMFNVFQSLIKHTTIDCDSHASKNKKKLSIETVSHRTAEGYNHQLIICDAGTKTKKQPEKVIESLRGIINKDQYKEENNTDYEAYATKFLSVCDWSIKGVFAGKSQELLIQPFKPIKDSILPINDNSCDGFTHIFTFYDV